jgi:hypothetical protein
MDGLGAKLAAAGGDVTAERELLQDAFESYCDIRAAADDPIPEAYFTHQFADVRWNADTADFHRWVDLAVEVAGG